MKKVGRSLKWYVNSHVLPHTLLTLLLGLLEILEGKVPQVRTVTDDKTGVRAYLRYWVAR